MTMTGRGLCANTVISCSSLVACQSDNMTCSEPNTVCVNNTRCGVPVCFPISRASNQQCPPLASTNSTATAGKHDIIEVSDKQG